MVETTLDRQLKRLKLQVAKVFRKAEIAKLAQSSFGSGTKIVSDGLFCCKRVETTSFDHFSLVSSSGKKAAQ